MIGEVRSVNGVRPWIEEKLFLGLSTGDYAKKLITPFHIIAGIILLAGLPLLVIRFSQGLASVTSASDAQPFGLFLTVGLFVGVPLSATGYVLGSAVYLFGLKQFRPVLTNAILLGFLGYLFAVIFLLTDLGRPWRLPYPMFVSYGPASVLFLVAWHVALYLSCQAAEFAPSAFEWLGLRSLRRWALRFTIVLTIFGVMLSTLHQSALGAMFLLMPGKLHPLWYTPYLPWLFFISSIAAGLSMVIVVSALSKRFFRDRAEGGYLASLDGITLGLGKGASFVLFSYFGLKVMGVAYGHHWDLLNTSYGYWFLAEILAFVLLPAFLFNYGARMKNVGLVRITALITVLGIMINRLNVTLIAFNWDLPDRELFYWKEVVIVIAIITIEVLVYRWIVNRMPILREDPDYEDESD